MWGEGTSRIQSSSGTQFLVTEFNCCAVVYSTVGDTEIFTEMFKFNQTKRIRLTSIKWFNRFKHRLLTEWNLRIQLCMLWWRGAYSCNWTAFSLLTFSNTCYLSPQVYMPLAFSPPSSLPMLARSWLVTRRPTFCLSVGQTTQLWAASQLCSTSQSAAHVRATPWLWCWRVNPSRPRTPLLVFTVQFTQW